MVEVEVDGVGAVEEEEAGEAVDKGGAEEEGEGKEGEAGGGVGW